MAKKMTTDPTADAKGKAKKSAPQRKRRRKQENEGGFILLVAVGLLGLVPFSYEAAGLVFIGIVPSIVMSLTDQKAWKSERLQCIALMNLAGVLPYAVSISENKNLWPGMLADYQIYVPMWGSAAVGYIVLSIGPVIGAIVLQAFAQDKLKNLAQQRQELIDLWGHEVLGDTEKKEEPKDNFIRPKRS